MEGILITNNEFVKDKYKDHIDIIYDKDFLYLDVLKTVRDKIHIGHKLLTHPLSGSVKPNETPYKSIIISRETGELDQNGLNIIEESILVAKKFSNDKKTPNWSKRILDDFKTIDLLLISPAIEKLDYNA